MIQLVHVSAGLSSVPVPALLGGSAIAPQQLEEESESASFEGGEGL